MVTAKAVYHWSLDGDNVPEKIFDRTPCRRREDDGTEIELPANTVQITHYRCTQDEQWLLVGGITTARPSEVHIVGVQGVLQVYSVAHRTSQPLMDSPAACFAECYLNDDIRDDPTTKPAKLLCFVRAFNGSGPRALHIVQLDVPRDDATSKTSPLPLEAGDFPVALTPNNRAGLLWITTK
jgi:clathrin heavy chain